MPSFSPFRGWLGWALIVGGILLNPWLVGFTLAADGSVDGALSWWLIVGGELLLILAGVALLRPSVGGIPGFSGPARGPLLVLAGLVLLVVLVELVSFGILWMRSPEYAARFTRQRHAILGGGPPERTVPFYPLYGWKPPSGQKESGAPGGGITYHRDRYGFITHSPSDTTALEPNADRRIVVLGGSTVRGFWTPARESVPAQLERMLESRSGHSVNVLNAGVVGWFSVNELAYLVHEVLAFYEPDAVIVLDGLNDTWRAVRAAKKFDRAPDGWWESPSGYLYDPTLEEYRRKFRLLQKRPGFVLNQFLHVLGVRPYLIPTRYYLGALLTASPGSTVDEPLRERVDRMERSRCRELPVNPHPYVANVRSMLGAARAHNVDFIHVLQPAIVYKEHLTREERRFLNQSRVRLFFDGYPLLGETTFQFPRRSCWARLVRTFFEAAGGELRERGRETRSSGVRLRNWSDLFAEDRERRFSDSVHYTGSANRLIARRLAETLRSMQAARKQSRSTTPSDPADT